MIRMLLYLMLLAPALADVVQIDAAGLVVGSATTEAGVKDPTVTVTSTTAPLPGRDLFDEFGRCTIAIDASGVPSKIPTPKWSTSAAIKLSMQAQVLVTVDALSDKILTLREWQASYINVRDRSLELSDALKRRDALIAVIQGQ